MTVTPGDKWRGWLMNWLSNFDDRQQKEIEFCKLYAEKFSHGTDGHSAKLIIAKMASILNEIENEVKDSEDAGGSLLTIATMLQVRL